VCLTVLSLLAVFREPRAMGKERWAPRTAWRGGEKKKGGNPAGTPAPSFQAPTVQAPGERESLTIGTNTLEHLVNSPRPGGFSPRLC